MLLLTLYTAFKYGSMEGQITGFLSGFGMDIFSGGLFGVHAFTKTVIGFTIGSFQKRIYTENVPTILLFIFIASFFNGLVFALMNVIFMPVLIKFWDYIINILIFEMLYNCVVGLILFLILERLDRVFVKN